MLVETFIWRKEKKTEAFKGYSFAILIELVFIEKNRQYSLCRKN